MCIKEIKQALFKIIPKIAAQIWYIKQFDQNLLLFELPIVDIINLTY